MLDAILREIELRKEELSGEMVETIYFGGGTPSLLGIEEIKRILDKIGFHHSISDAVEITLEANPDDLDSPALTAISNSPVNRLSIGIQSFFDEDLVFMNRAHKAMHSEQCVRMAREMGFEDISIDLIYGSPTTSDEMWSENLEKATLLDIPHLSAYCLTVEEGTALHHFVRKGKVKPVDDERADRQFHTLIAHAVANGYEHYEISNFAKGKRYSRHNTSYWQGKPYLGFGPAAHSFNGKMRRWNVANNAHYIKSVLEEGVVPFDSELLHLKDTYNEYMMTGLRTMWGVRLEQVPEKFKEHFMNIANENIQRGWVAKKEGFYVLTATGKSLADRIAMEFFYSE